MDHLKKRDLGFKIGLLPAGKKNCITDVTGVPVGHVTLKEDLENGSIRWGDRDITSRKELIS